MTRGQRGRPIGRQMIALAVFVGIIAPAIAFVASPGYMIAPPVSVDAIYGLSVLSAIVGLVWMVRIHRANPEPDQGTWRYRAKR
jgi:hypothetical protein